MVQYLPPRLGGGPRLVTRASRVTQKSADTNKSVCWYNAAHQQALWLEHWLMLLNNLYTKQKETINLGVEFNGNVASWATKGDHRKKSANSTSLPTHSCTWLNTHCNIKQPVNYDKGSLSTHLWARPVTLRRWIRLSARQIKDRRLEQNRRRVEEERSEHERIRMGQRGSERHANKDSNGTREMEMYLRM